MVFNVTLATLVVVLLCTEQALAVLIPSQNDFVVVEPRNIRSQVTWVDFKNKKVIRQQYDLSCGAASVATILTYYFGMPTSEQELVDEIGKEGMMSSFADLNRIALSKGFRTNAFKVKVEHLQDALLPCIVHLKIGQMFHFSVFRGCNEDRIWLGDPARGNVIVDITKFSKWFYETSPDRKREEQYGNVLFLLPDDENQSPSNPSFFGWGNSENTAISSELHMKILSNLVECFT